MEYKIEVNGEELSLDFSTRTLAIFARKNQISLDEITGGFHLDLYGILLLFYFAVREGARKSGETLPPNFSEDLISDWIDKDPALAGNFLKEYYSSQGLTMTSEEAKDVEKISA